MTIIRRKHGSSGADITGRRFGRLVAVRPIAQRRRGRLVWECLCDCGKTAFATGSDIRRGCTRSCGCVRSEFGQAKAADLTGQRFALLTVIERDRSQGFEKPRWIVKCDCGNTKSVKASNMKNGTVRSCGCLLRLKGQDHTAWKGGRFYREGYVMLRYWQDGSLITIGEHRAVTAKAIGRDLLESENVHHKNGVRDDNRIENLELWVKTQPCGQRPGDIVNHCVELLQRYAPSLLQSNTEVA